jgi:aryl-alcohol dehydrogenase-like predicted oxidoreductase
VLYPGGRNYAAWQTQRAWIFRRQHGWAPLQVTQPMYNLVKRQAEWRSCRWRCQRNRRQAYSRPAAACLGEICFKKRKRRAAGTNKMYEEPLRRALDARNRGGVRRISAAKRGCIP